MTGGLVGVRAARDLLAYFFLDVLVARVVWDVAPGTSNARRFAFLRKGSKLARCSDESTDPLYVREMAHARPAPGDILDMMCANTPFHPSEEERPPGDLHGRVQGEDFGM